MPTLLSDIFARVRRRCDMVNSAFLSDANDLLPWVNASHRELYELLVTTYGSTYFMIRTDATVSATEMLELDDVFKLLRVDAVFDNVRVPMRPFQLGDEILDTSDRDWGPGVDIRYHLSGLASPYTATGKPVLLFHPIPASDHVVRYYHVPACEQHSTFSVAAIIGPAEIWDEYIVVDAAIKAKNKEESDPQALMVEKAELRQRIHDSAPNFDAGQAKIVQDVQSVHGDNSVARGEWWW